MKFLILSVTAGQGHYQCAKATYEALLEKGHEAFILDVYEYVSHPLGKTLDKGYLLSTKYAPELYGKLYQAADSYGIGSGLTKETQKLMYKKVAEYINDFCPDAIIATHVFPCIMLTSAIKHKKIKPVPTIGIVTDFTLHPYWQKTHLSAYVVPSELLGYQCEKKNIPAEKIYPLGIPISKKFSYKIPKNEARRLLDIPSRNTILVMSGSMGFGDVPSLLEEIDLIDGDFQILCVCGNNKESYKKIASSLFLHDVYTYGFVNNIDIMMDASDFIITKPGGLSISEALSKNLPIILGEPIPGQETRNREFLLNSGLALSVSKTLSVGEAVYRLNKSEALRKNMENASVIFSRPNASSDVADLAVSLAKNN